MSDDTARVNMVWPKSLKERVQDAVGPRGLTEFVLEAVELHLGGAADLHQTQDELNKTKHIAQQLADTAAINSSPALRLEAFMELELPSWIDTSGWPSEFAKRVHPEALAEVDRNARAYGYEVGKGQEPAEVITTSEDNPFMETKVEPVVDPEAVPMHPTEVLGNDGLTDGERADALASFQAGVGATPEVQELPDEGDFFAKKTGSGDLFARIMEKTGGDPLMSQLKPASEVPAPEPSELTELTPKEERYAKQDVTATDPVITEKVAELEPDSAKTQVLLDAVATDVPLAQVVENRCIKCGDELIDGECWTCG